MAKTIDKVLYRIDWYDTETEAGWVKPAKTPPIVSQPVFILEWPNDEQEVRAYRVCAAWCEKQPGDSSIIPEGMVLGVQKIETWEIYIR